MKTIVFLLSVSAVFAALNIELSHVEGDVVKYTMRNSHSASLEYSDIHTPLTTVMAPLFCLQNEFGEKIEYYGPVAKMVKGRRNVIKAAEKKEVDIRLGDFYEFTSPGVHSVRYCAGKTSDILKVDITAEHVKYSQEKKANLLFSLKAAETDLDKEAAITFSGCDSTEETKVNTAMTDVTSGFDLVNCWPPSGSGKRTLFVEWFGTYSVSAGQEIDGHFQAIGSALSGSWISKCNDPGCSPGVFAFVYKGDTSHTIHLCDTSFAASTTWSQDSLPGVLVHEMSHFNDVTSTDDEAYGPTNCRNLAISNPTLARDNADSHEYFCEFGIPGSSSSSCEYSSSAGSGGSSGSGSGGSSGGGSGGSSGGGSGGSSGGASGSVSDSIPSIDWATLISNCTSAIAANGSSISPRLRTVRSFRDEVLDNYAIGKRFIDFYYRKSDDWAPVLREHESARFAVRTVLWPIIWVLEFAGF